MGWGGGEDGGGGGGAFINRVGFMVTGAGVTRVALRAGRGCRENTEPLSVLIPSCFSFSHLQHISQTTGGLEG